MAEEKDTAAPAKRNAGKTGRRKKPEAEHAARAAPQDKDTGSKAQDILEQARTESKPEWEVAEQVVLLPLDRLQPFKNHPFKVSDEDELMQDTIDSIMAGGVINPILVRPAEDGKFEVVSGHRRFRASELVGKTDIKAIVREMDDDTAVITMVDSNNIFRKEEKEVSTMKILLKILCAPLIAVLSVFVWLTAKLVQVSAVVLNFIAIAVGLGALVSSWTERPPRVSAD